MEIDHTKVLDQWLVGRCLQPASAETVLSLQKHCATKQPSNQLVAHCWCLSPNVCQHFYRTRVRSLTMLVTHWLTDSLLFGWQWQGMLFGWLLTWRISRDIELTGVVAHDVYDMVLESPTIPRPLRKYQVAGTLQLLWSRQSSVLAVEKCISTKKWLIWSSKNEE